MAHYLISEASRRLNVEAHVLRYWEEELKLEIPRNELGHRYYTEKQLALFQRIKELKELGYQLKAIRTSLNQEEGLELNADEAGFLLEEDREHPVKVSAGAPEEKTEHASLDDMDQEGAGTEEIHSRQKDKPAEARFKVLDGEGHGKASENGGTDAGIKMDKQDEQSGTELSVSESSVQSGLTASPEKMEQFQAIMTDVLTEALRRNNSSFSDAVSGQVSEKVVKEMNFLMRDREEREEERYRKLDETIRACQRVQKQKNEAAATKVPVRKLKKRRFGRRKEK
ncbi:helix-turn-helix domain-containing protein [Lientehia hominis]|uniref:helix-turn-helix domain-containing protein n=1 Tax=Lientehia hominis TaxID=2897778 RepID=UPI002EDB70CD